MITLALIIGLSQAVIPQADIPTMQLREELRIVSNNSSPQTMLTGASAGSTVLPDGRILVLDMREASIRVFDSTGKFLSMFGRRGDGPGEFRTAYIVGTRGDSIWVADIPLRYHIFSPEFKPIARVGPFPRSSATFGTGPGRAFMAQSATNPDSVNILSATGQILRRVAVELRSRGHQFQVRDPGTPGTDPASGGSGSARGRASGSTAAAAIQPQIRPAVSPLAATTRITMSRDGLDVFVFEPGEIWGGRPGQFRFNRVSWTTGQLSTPVTVSLPARRVTASERDSLLEAASARNPRTQDEYRRLARVPEYYPPFSSVQAMGGGLIWLSEDGRSGQPLVMDASGRIMMRLALPEGLIVFAATRTHVWGILRDADDLRVILRYAVVDSR